MKKVLFIIALVFTLGFSAYAQFDSFVPSWENDNIRTIDNPIIALPSMHYMDENTPAAPLGSGILMLTALGGCYAAFRKRKH